MKHFSSDSHFFHKNIMKYSNRPFTTVEEMNDCLVDNWNRVVKPNDDAYHLGDFGFANIMKTKSILKRLNGNIYFVYGNHDKELIRHRKELLQEKLFASMLPYMEIKENKQSIVLFHYGMRVWNKHHYGSWLLYGHSHGTLPPYGKSVDVGVDCKEITDEYRPVSFDEIYEFMKNRDIINTDYHER